MPRTSDRRGAWTPSNQQPFCLPSRGQHIRLTVEEVGLEAVGARRRRVGVERLAWGEQRGRGRSGGAMGGRLAQAALG